MKRGERSLRSKLLDGLAFRINARAALRTRDSADIVAATRRAMVECGVELLEMEETFGVAQLVKRALPIPVVVQLHGPFFANGVAARLLEEPGSRQRLRYEGAAIAEADGVTAPSREILERTRAYYQLPLPGAAVIPAPAPTVPPNRRWLPADCDRNAILFVGRLDRHKGGDLVIESFRRLAPDFPQLRLWFVGRDHGFIDDSSRHWTLPEYLAENAPEIAERVDILGHISTTHLEALRPKAYCTVVASRYETFGMVVLEAMAYGCPLVATRTGGIPEIVESGVNGILCRADAGDLTAALGMLLRDPELAARLGERAGEDAARRYNAESLARERVEFHRNVIERHASKRRRTA